MDGKKLQRKLLGRRRAFEDVADAIQAKTRETLADDLTLHGVVIHEYKALGKQVE